MGQALVGAADWLARWAVPAMVLGVLGFGLARKVRVYEAFIRGARSGLALGLRLVPYMVAMVSATELFRKSGAMEQFAGLAGPTSRWIGIPPEVLPVALIRPLSGSAATAVVALLLKHAGPDSLVGRMASVMQGSTETTLYVITVYLGAVGIRDPRWALVTGLLADVAGFVAAAAFTHLFLG